MPDHHHVHRAIALTDEGVSEAIAVQDGKDLKQRIITVDKAQRMAEFFGVLGDPNRWRILSALAVQEMRVRDLAEVVEMTESAVSHQLRILRTMRLVRYSKQGRNVFYSLKDSHILNLYRDASEHLDESD
ncbi:MAG: metalloregulator ArsR/SmtB family transcription factor [Thermosynechococcaceae cyanobacterium MS004]|nr:metalloregulator ArsR/SmtB family transcription factor [Thermosynechococcaceae cyanobacterium MS004]